MTNMVQIANYIDSSKLVNIMAADDSATQVTRASAAMVLT